MPKRARGRQQRSTRSSRVFLRVAGPARPTESPSPLKSGLRSPETGPVRAPRRPRFAWLIPIAAGAVLGGLAWRAPAPASAAGRSGVQEGALEELAQARLEQALIRADTTAHLLGLLAGRPQPEGGP